VRAKLTFQADIEATHPMNNHEQAVEADSLAMKLVGERRSKRDLVDLVRWLILRNPDGLFPNIVLDVLFDAF
jgi:hypothetical protein